jgi:arabinofuranosyltransferase
MKFPKPDLRYLLIFCLLLFVVIVLRTAWMCDDSFITLRTVDNVVHGYGLTWNSDERVQVYTHPLWMMLLTLVYFVTREPFLTTIFLSIIISSAALTLLAFRVSKTIAAACLGVLILALSKSFTDFSTSGLENPLSHLLIALFLIIYLKSQKDLRSLLLLSGLAALGTLTRFDLLLVFAPMLIYRFWQVKSWQAVRTVVAGFVPFILWELFSLFYYGFLFPNTAYAKLSTGIPHLELAMQGLYYLSTAVTHDPIVAVTIIAAIGLGIWRRDEVGRSLASAIVLYLLYVVSIGGCFMAGRYFTVPLFLAVALLSQMEMITQRKCWLPILGVVLVVGMASPYCPLYAGSDFGTDKSKLSYGRGITDERTFYFQQTGFLVDGSLRTKPINSWVDDGLRFRTQGPIYTKKSAVGIVGFYSGPDVHILDIYGLCDPLLARLPALMDVNWRIGHFVRAIPGGYDETLKSHRNLLVDRELIPFYDTLSLIVRGELFDMKRLMAVVRMNLGAYDHFLQNAAPLPLMADLTRISNPLPAGTPWSSAEGIILPTKGVLVNMFMPVRAPFLEIGLNSNDDYALTFLYWPNIVGSVEITAGSNIDKGLIPYRIAVPEEAVRSGYDAIGIQPTRGDKNYALGYILLLDSSFNVIAPPGQIR